MPCLQQIVRKDNWSESRLPPLTELSDAGIENLCAAVVADAVKKWNQGGVLRREAEEFFLSDRFLVYGFDTSGEEMIRMLNVYGGKAKILPVEAKKRKRGDKSGKDD